MVILAAVVCLLAAPASRVHSAAPLDLSRLVGVGDSLLAGYQNDSLLATQQVHGPASVIAAQARVALPLPLIAAPGVPNVIVHVDPGPPPVFVRAPGVSTGRLDPLLQAMNLAVPGHTVHDALNTRPGVIPPADVLTNLVLGFPGLLSGIARSQVEWAEALAPTAVLLWIGSNDALGAILIADPAALTPLASFTSDFAQIMTRLSATGAPVVVGTLPDVTRVPFLTRAEEVARLVGLPLAVIGPLGITVGDAVTPSGLALVPSILSGAVPGPLPPHTVLTQSEALTIRTMIDRYNDVILSQARLHDATLFDAHAQYNGLHDRGYVVQGRRLTTAFLGGIFSLDGIHPTNTAHAIVANEILQQMNRQLGAAIPRLSIVRVAVSDPLVAPLLATAKGQP
jgi:lysophospholipase L1-like esterase